MYGEIPKKWNRYQREAFADATRAVELVEKHFPVAYWEGKPLDKEGRLFEVKLVLVDPDWRGGIIC